jgi:hypothetical protein
MPSDDPAGFGVVWMVQEVPFHASASGASLVEPKEVPTAVQASAATQDTAVRALLTDPAGLGVVWMVQEVPFHASANGAWPVEFRYEPTAVHTSTDTHDTPARTAWNDPAGVTVG